MLAASAEACRDRRSSAASCAAAGSTCTVATRVHGTSVQKAMSFAFVRRCPDRGQRRGRLRKLARRAPRAPRYPRAPSARRASDATCARQAIDVDDRRRDSRPASALDDEASSEQIGGVDHAFEPLPPRLRLLDERHQPLRERDQRRGKVAAVDGRDVARVEWRQRRGVVPVEEVAFVPLEAAERRQRAVETIDQRRGRDVAEVVRRQRRQQRHADVGRRCAPRQPRLVTSW